MDIVCDLWKEQKDPDAVLALVVDKNPVRLLGVHCKSFFQRELADGNILEVAFADPEILQLAEEAAASVFSNDRIRTLEGFILGLMGI